MNSSYFKTGKRLQTAINNAEKIEGFQEWLDLNFAYLYFDLDGKEAEKALKNREMFDCPYWMEKYWDQYNEKGETKYWCEYVAGWFETIKVGDIINGYKYVDSQPLSEEIEHQAEDGKYIYEYRGYSFLRIWEKL